MAAADVPRDAAYLEAQRAKWEQKLNFPGSSTLEATLEHLHEPGVDEAEWLESVYHKEGDRRVTAEDVEAEEEAGAEQDAKRALRARMAGKFRNAGKQVKTGLLFKTVFSREQRKKEERKQRKMVRAASRREQAARERGGRRRMEALDDSQDELEPENTVGTLKLTLLNGKNLPIEDQNDKGFTYVILNFGGKQKISRPARVAVQGTYIDDVTNETKVQYAHEWNQTLGPFVVGDAAAQKIELRVVHERKSGNTVEKQIECGAGAARLGRKVRDGMAGGKAYREFTAYREEVVIDLKLPPKKRKFGDRTKSKEPRRSVRLLVEYTPDPRLQRARSDSLGTHLSSDEDSDVSASGSEVEERHGAHLLDEEEEEFERMRRKNSSDVRARTGFAASIGNGPAPERSMTGRHAQRAREARERIQAQIARERARDAERRASLGLGVEQEDRYSEPSEDEYEDVLENEEVYTFDEMLDMTAKTNENRGTVYVELVSGRNLMNCDFLSLSDPYCIFSLSNDFYSRQEVRSTVIEDSLNPDWNERLDPLHVSDCLKQTLRCDMYDEDVGPDDFMGYCEVDLADPYYSILGGRIVTVTKPLLQGQGEVTFRVRWEPDPVAQDEHIQAFGSRMRASSFINSKQLALLNGSKSRLKPGAKGKKAKGKDKKKAKEPVGTPRADSPSAGGSDDAERPSSGLAMFDRDLLGIPAYIEGILLVTVTDGLEDIIPRRRSNNTSLVARLGGNTVTVEVERKNNTNYDLGRFFVSSFDKHRLHLEFVYGKKQTHLAEKKIRINSKKLDLRSEVGKRVNVAMKERDSGKALGKLSLILQYKNNPAYDPAQAVGDDSEASFASSGSVPASRQSSFKHKPADIQPTVPEDEDELSATDEDEAKHDLSEDEAGSDGASSVTSKRSRASRSKSKKKKKKQGKKKSKKKGKKSKSKGKGKKDKKKKKKKKGKKSKKAKGQPDDGAAAAAGEDADAAVKPGDAAPAKSKKKGKKGKKALPPAAGIVRGKLKLAVVDVVAGEPSEVPMHCTFRVGKDKDAPVYRSNSTLEPSDPDNPDSTKVRRWERRVGPMDVLNFEKDKLELSLYETVVGGRPDGGDLENLLGRQKMKLNSAKLALRDGGTLELKLGLKPMGKIHFKVKFAEERSEDMVAIAEQEEEQEEEEQDQVEEEPEDEEQKEEEESDSGSNSSPLPDHGNINNVSDVMVSPRDEAGHSARESLKSDARSRMKAAAAQRRKRLKAQGIIVSDSDSDVDEDEAAAAAAHKPGKKKQSGGRKSLDQPPQVELQDLGDMAARNASGMLRLKIKNVTNLCDTGTGNVLFSDSSNKGRRGSKNLGDNQAMVFVETSLLGRESETSRRSSARYVGPGGSISNWNVHIPSMPVDNFALSTLRIAVRRQDKTDNQGRAVLLASADAPLTLPSMTALLRNPDEPLAMALPLSLPANSEAPHSPPSINFVATFRIAEESEADDGADESDEDERKQSDDVVPALKFGGSGGPDAPLSSASDSEEEEEAAVSDQEDSQVSEDITPRGQLQVTLLKCTELPNRRLQLDPQTGNLAPAETYVSFRVGTRGRWTNSRKVTTSRDRSSDLADVALDPVWNEPLERLLPIRHQLDESTLYLRVHDHSGKVIGRCELPLASQGMQLATGHEYERKLMWKHGSGDVSFKVAYVPPGNPDQPGSRRASELAENVSEADPEANSPLKEGLLHVHLQDISDLAEPMNVYAVFGVTDSAFSEELKSETIQNSDNPEWDAQLGVLKVQDYKTQTLQVDIYHRHKPKRSRLLGYVDVALDNLGDGEIGEVETAIIKEPEDEDEDEDEDEEVGTLRFSMQLELTPLEE